MGYSAFLVFALARRVRVYVWEGGERVDLCEVMLPPWKAKEVTRQPAVDAIACCAVPRDAGPPDWAPVSERYPLQRCTHFVAGLSIGIDDATGDPDTVDGFYAARGVYVVSTVEDGDCALDCMLKMCEEVSTAETRGQLREDTYRLRSPPLPREFCLPVGETTVDVFFPPSANSLLPFPSAF